MLAHCWHEPVFRGTIAATAAAISGTTEVFTSRVKADVLRPSISCTILMSTPGREAERGAAVPQVMEPDRRQPRLADQDPEVLGDKVIMAAVGRQAVSPETAIRWARRAARGEDISAVGLLSAGTARHVEAHSNANLAGQIMSILTQILEGMGGDGDQAGRGRSVAGGFVATRRVGRQGAATLPTVPDR